MEKSLRGWMMKNLITVCISFCILISACSDDNGDSGNGGGGDEYPETTAVKITFDRNTVLRNPLNGWVAYVNRGAEAGFWSRNDMIYVPDIGEYVKLSDYASTAYFRTSWSSLNPRENEYIWDNPDSALMQNIREALNRGMRLAFRIVVDGRDQGLNTPQYVFDAGAGWFPDDNGSNPESRKSPYPDDIIFQQKYTRFIEAFAEKFNDPDMVDFIDGYGLGKWGEAHSMLYKDVNNREAVFEWITDLYTRCFDKIPLAINYHRLVGVSNTTGWGAVDPETEKLLRSAINKGYSLRHDAFGMNDYYQQWEKEYVRGWNYKRPVIMEGGWITGGTHRYWIDSSNKYREGHPEDVRRGEFEASEEARVNMMDFRVGNETESWFQLCYGLVQRFITEGGYRLYPDEIRIPEKINSNEEIKITHRWLNMGWGYCPTNIPQWNQKYKVAFAILDEQNNTKKIFVDEETDLSTWLKGFPTTYEFITKVTGITAGNYSWAVGIVDRTKDNKPGIKIAAKDNVLSSGWVKLVGLTVE